MKEKEPDKLFFSADESPVPLPSVEDAWSDMRKKLDEEMPERAAFFIWRRAGLMAIGVLLSLCLFWFVARRGKETHPAPLGTIVTAKDSQGPGKEKYRREGTEVDHQTAKAAKALRQGRDETTEISHLPRVGKINDRPGKDNSRPQRQQVGTIHQTGTDKSKLQRVQVGTIHHTGTDRSKLQQEQVGTIHWTGTSQDHLTGTARANHRTGMDQANYRTGTSQANHLNDQVAVEQSMEGAPGHQPIGPAATTPDGGMRPRDAGRTIIDSKIPRISLPDSIRIWVNIPSRTTGMPGKIAAAQKKNATKPMEPKKIKAGDSTRIWWAAGFQDSKSFPVGAQQPVDYNADLKKDLWFDYIPSPYFQYFISRKIGFQVGLQFNSPQYTEAVSIYRTPPIFANITRTFVPDTVLVVKKLYYLSLPLTIYYSPLRNLYLGAGLQYSNLRNGVALQNNLIHYTGIGSGQPDTVTSSKLIDLKDYRPAYSNLKRTDWRALFEMNYYWKRITLGAQYQQGLGDYLYTPVDGATGKDRNSSFNVYLRYNIWERRIRIVTH